MKSFWQLNEGLYDAQTLETLNRFRYFLPQVLVKFSIPKAKQYLDILKKFNFELDHWVNLYQIERWNSIFEQHLSGRAISDMDMRVALDNDYGKEVVKTFGIDPVPILDGIYKHKLRSLLQHLLDSAEELYLHQNQFTCKKFLLDNIDRIQLTENWRESVDELTKELALAKNTYNEPLMYRFFIGVVKTNQDDPDIDNCFSLIKDHDRIIRGGMPQGAVSLEQQYTERLIKIMLSLPHGYNCDEVVRNLGNTKRHSAINFNVPKNVVLNGSDLDIIRPENVSWIFKDSEGIQVKNCFSQKMKSFLQETLEQHADDARGDLAILLREIIGQLKEASEKYNSGQAVESYYPWLLYHSDDLTVLLETMPKILYLYKDDLGHAIDLHKNIRIGKLKTEERNLSSNLDIALSCTIDGYSLPPVTSRIRWKDIDEEKLKLLEDLMWSIDVENEVCGGQFNIQANLNIMEQLPWSDDSLIKAMKKAVKMKKPSPKRKASS